MSHVGIPYLDAMLSIPHLTPVSLLTFLLLGMCRFAPIVASVPFLGGKVMPKQARAILAIFLTIIYLPIIISTSSRFVTFDIAFLAFGLKEVVIGFLLAFIITIPFYMVQTAGIIITYQRGSSQLIGQDPTQKIQASPMGTVYNYILIAMFFTLDGPFYFFDAVVISYEVIPVTAFINSDFFGIKIPFWASMTGIINQMFAMGIQIAAPAIISILMTEVFLGVANRLAPQVQIAFLGMSLKSLVGLGMVWLGWLVVLKQFGSFSIEWVHSMPKMIRIISPFVDK